MPNTTCKQYRPQALSNGLCIFLSWHNLLDFALDNKTKQKDNAMCMTENKH